MTAYEVRVQIATDDQRFFDFVGFRRVLAHAAYGTYGVTKVWVNDQEFIPGQDVLEGDECLLADDEEDANV